MKITKSNLGLTLIEIIVTIGILSFVTLLLLSVFANAYFHIKNAGDDTVGLYDSQTDLEYVIATEVTGASDDGTVLVFDGDDVDVDGAVVLEDNLVSFIPGTVSPIPASSLLSITLDTPFNPSWSPLFNSLIHDYIVTINGETGNTPPSIDADDCDLYTEGANVSITDAINYTGNNETVITVEFDGDVTTYTLSFVKN